MPQGTMQQLDDAVEEVMTLMFERSCTPVPGTPSTFPATATHIYLSDPLNGASSLYIDIDFAHLAVSKLSPPMKNAAHGSFLDILTRVYQVGRMTLVIQLAFYQRAI